MIAHRVLTRVRSTPLAALTTVLLTGFAHMPSDQSVNYYLPRGVTEVTVVQTLACSSHSHKVISTSNVSSATNYAAAVDIPPQTLSLSNFGKGYSDPDFDMSFTNDGRLKAINANTVGEGPSVVKSLMTVATLAGGGVAFRTFIPMSETPSESDVCNEIAAASGGKSPMGSKKDTTYAVSIVRTASLKYGIKSDDYLTAKQTGANSSYLEKGSELECKLPEHQSPHQQQSVYLNKTELSKGDKPPPVQLFNALPDLNSEALLRAHPTLRNLTGPICVAILESSQQPFRSRWTGQGSVPGGYEKLTLSPVVNVTLAVVGPNPDAHEIGELWRSNQAIPVPEAAYAILIPNGSAFGTQKFALSLADDGSIAEIHYGAGGGVTDMGAAIQSIAKAWPTDANIASELSFKSDLIYQQQRWAKCQLTPTNCQPK